VSTALLFARAGRPGVPISGVWLAAVALTGVILSACGPAEPLPPAGRRVWQGPGEFVASRGITRYERREIAQQVLWPTCIEIASETFRYTRVVQLPGSSTTPPGLFDTGFQLDRWRLWTREPQFPTLAPLFLTVRGSTSLLAEYERVHPEADCKANG